MHTVAKQSRSSDGTTIVVPALILNGSKTDARLKNAARAVAEAVPGARHVELDRQTHNVKPAVLASAVDNFWKAALARNGR